MIDFWKKNKINIVLLLLIAGVVSVPLMTDYVLAGTNLQASLSRIEALREGLGMTFPLRVGPTTNADYGYGAVSFQADVFLLVPALFRLAGLGVGFSYKLFLFLINLATAAVAKYCFVKMFGRKDIGMLGSMLYTWCPYRCSDMYVNANLGETVAWTFVPIVILGLAELYKASWEEKDNRCVWGTLTLGLSLLLLSSATFFFVAVGVMVITFFCMGRRSLRRTTVCCVVKTAFATLFVNAWFLIPMLLRMRDAEAVQSLICQNFRMSGVYLAQYLSIFPSVGDCLHFEETGAVSAQEMGCGAAVVILLLIYLWCLFIKKFRDDLGEKVLCVTVIVAILSSNSFPWDLLQNKNMLCSVVLALLQSPAKWGVMACGGLIVIACRMLQKLSESKEGKQYKIVSLITVAVSVATTQYQTGRLLQTRSFVRPDAGEEWGQIKLPVLMQESSAWRLYELVSVVTLCVLIIMWIVRRQRSVKKVGVL